MNEKKLYLLSGISYLIIFFTAIFANFFVLEQIPTNPDIVNTLTFRFGILAFLITIVFDVIIAWALYVLYKSNISILSSLFRTIHAIIFAAGVFALPLMIGATTQDITQLYNTFTYLWLIGLFFFGFHLILLAKILKPMFLRILLPLAGAAYIIDTIAHFLMPNYDVYSGIFLAFVATISVVAEFSFTIWLIIKGLQKRHT